LHGLDFESSKLLIRRRINEIKDKINDGEYESYCLNIITGKGNHSSDKSPILLPRLSTYFKEAGIKHRINRDYGCIKVFI